MQNEFLREMKRGEETAVAGLLRAAFGGEDEVRLVKALRKSGSVAGECVVPGPDGPLGYFALSAMRAPAGWLCLAPVAVAPEVQRRGLGRRMTGFLAAWAGAAQRTVVVLGDPSFYARAGFSAERAARLVTPYPVEHTLIARPGNDVPAERLVYPAAFGG